MKRILVPLLLSALGCFQYAEPYYPAAPGVSEASPAYPQPTPSYARAEGYSDNGASTAGYTSYGQASTPPLYPGGRFGYAGAYFGVGGMPGKNDIRPGFSWTVVVPPGGVIVTAVSSALLVGGLMFDAMAYAGGYDGEPLGTYVALGGMSEVLPGTEDLFYQGQSTGSAGGQVGVEGVSIDLYLTGSRNYDLTNSADVLTYGTGLNATLIAGLGQGGRARLMLGYEYRRVDFKARPDADNHGPMVGVGLEFSPGGHVAFSTQFRYVFTFGSASDYDFWDVSMGVGTYW